jgi:hypothetical protein
MDPLYTFTILGDTINIYTVPNICGSDSLVTAAEGWTELVSQGLTSKEGGYKLDVNVPALICKNSVGETVGILTYSTCVSTEGGDYFWVEFVYVKPAYRNNKLLNNMFIQLEVLASSRNIKYIEMGTNYENLTMRKAAVQIGFVAESVDFRKLPESFRKPTV